MGTARTMQVGRRRIAATRVAASLAVAAYGSFVSDPSPRASAVFLTAGLVWVPWSTILLFASEERRDCISPLGGPLGDVAMLATVQFLLPSTSSDLVVAYLAVIFLALVGGGMRIAAVVAAGTVSLVVVAAAVFSSADRPSGALLAVFTVAATAVLGLGSRTSQLQVLAARRYDQLRGKSDTILANVAESVIVTDISGCVLEANLAALRTMGVSDDNLVGRPCGEILGLHLGERPLDCSAGCALVDLLSRGADPTLGLEVWRRGPGGERQPLLANATAVAFGPDGSEVVHSIRDITRLKQAEEAKTLFLATASHELKTPLTVISGFAEALSRYDDVDPDTRVVAMEAIRARSSELSRIVDRLLLSSRIEAGRLKLELEEVDVGPVSVERAQDLAGATGRTILVTVEDDTPAAWANEDAVSTVVEHLLDNALKYSPDGQAVRLLVAGAGEFVRLDVVDEGIGMDSDQLAHCFDKFWQAESTDVRRFGGTGIGLYIVHSLVEAMGGSVTVESRRSVGTRFTVTLRPTLQRSPVVDVTAGEPTSIREFMRQIGVTTRRPA